MSTPSKRGGPWLLIVLIAVALVASVITIVIASRGADRSLGHETLPGLGIVGGAGVAREGRARQLGLSATLSAQGGEVVLELHPAVDVPSVTLRLRHPYAESHDIDVVLARRGDGRFAAAVPGLEAVRYQVTADAADWRIGGIWKPGTDGALGPGM